MRHVSQKLAAGLSFALELAKLLGDAITTAITAERARFFDCTAICSCESGWGPSREAVSRGGVVGVTATGVTRSGAGRRAGYPMKNSATPNMGSAIARL